MLDLREYPKILVLPNSTQVCIRPMKSDDQDLLFSFFTSIPKKARLRFKHDVTRRDVIDDWCRNLDYDRVLPLLTVVKENDTERIVADGTLRATRHGWATHVARIALVLAPDMRGTGLGKILLRELCDQATLRGIQKIQSHVREDNADAITLLKKLGFKKETVFKNHAMDLKGKMHDVIIYYQDVDDVWRNMEDLIIDSDFIVIP